MRYRITIEEMDRGDAADGGEDKPQSVMQVYTQTFEDMNVRELVTRLNHVPVKRPRKNKAAAK